MTKRDFFHAVFICTNSWTQGGLGDGWINKTEDIPTGDQSDSNVKQLSVVVTVTKRILHHVT